MPELKRALVESLGTHWTKLDLHVQAKFEAAAVLAKIWAPRKVAADKPSERIAGNDVPLALLESEEVEFELGKHDVEEDLLGLLTRAAETLAAKEDRRGVQELWKLIKAGEVSRSYESAEGELRETGVNDRLSVLVSPGERARLASMDKGHKSKLQYLEELLDVDPPHFQSTRALSLESKEKSVGLVTSKDPAPIVIVRAGSAQVRVKSVERNVITLQVVIGHAVAPTLTATVVAVVEADSEMSAKS